MTKEEKSLLHNLLRENMLVSEYYYSQNAPTILGWLLQVPEYNFAYFLNEMTFKDRFIYFTLNDFKGWYSLLSQNIYLKACDTTVNSLSVIKQETVKVLNDLLANNLLSHSINEIIYTYWFTQNISALTTILNCLNASNVIQASTLKAVLLYLNPQTRWITLGLDSEPTLEEVEELLAEI